MNVHIILIHTVEVKPNKKLMRLEHKKSILLFSNTATNYSSSLAGREVGKVPWVGKYIHMSLFSESQFILTTIKNKTHWSAVSQQKVKVMVSTVR